jgi:hypothetical protein
MDQATWVSASVTFWSNSFSRKSKARFIQNNWVTVMPMMESVASTTTSRIVLLFTLGAFVVKIAQKATGSAALTTY